MAHGRVAVLLGMLLVSGCKPPTFQELTGGGQPEEPAAAPVETPRPAAAAPPTTTPAPSPASVTPAAPPKIDPAAEIAQFRKIHSLDLNDVHLQRLATLETGLDGFESLDLAGSHVTEKGLSLLPKLTVLKELKLNSVTLTPAMREIIGKLAGLEKLSLLGSPVTSDDCAFLADLTALTDLNLNATQIDDRAFAHLETLVHLERLDVGHTRIDGSGFRVFDQKGKERQLKEIHAAHSGFATHGFEHIKGWKELEVLRVPQAGVSDLGMRIGVKTLSGLRDLDVSRNSVTDVGVRELAGLKNLERVSLGYNGSVSDQGAQFLKDHKKLTHLDLEGTSCTPQIVPFLRKTCPEIKVAVQGLTR